MQEQFDADAEALRTQNDRGGSAASMAATRQGAREGSLFGSAAAFDAPVLQTFVPELVGDEDLHNAVALNSTSFNAARTIGPAVSGAVIAAIGTGWAFLINGASFAAVLISLAFHRISELHPNAREEPSAGSGGLLLRAALRKLNR